MNAIDQPKIAYYRVSTKKQGTSKLGLEAQKNLIFGYLRKTPDFEFTDIETGAEDDRMQLSQAIKLSKEIGGKLVVATLDRLSRDVHFISGLIKNCVDFACADDPTATPFTLHIKASVAQEERRMIKERTKRAIQARIDREIAKGNINFKWGSFNNGGGFNPNREPKEGVMTIEEVIQARRESVRKKAKSNPNILAVLKMIERMTKDGMICGEIANELNLFGFNSPAGKPKGWSNVAVERVQKYFDLGTNKGNYDHLKEFQFKKGIVRNIEKPLIY